MADGDTDTRALASMEAVLAEAAAHGVTKVVVAIDLRAGYDEADGIPRCSSVATSGPGGRLVASCRGHSPNEAIIATLRQLGAIF